MTSQIISPSSKIIFFGNGPLADYTKQTLLEKGCEIIFHARKKSDLEEVKRLKSTDKKGELHGILASFGVIIKQDVLNLFESEGILNIHPSLLPKYRGPSPIEAAILDGNTKFGVSIMKLVKAMDAGPIYHQDTFDSLQILSTATYYRDGILADFPMDATPAKDDIYFALAFSAATWLAENLHNLPAPTAQDDTSATYTKKLDKSMSPLDPKHKTASELDCQIRAFAGFPKSKYDFFNLDCTIISAHVATPEESKIYTNDKHSLFIRCYDNSVLVIDEIQPAGRKIMDAKSFLNGYAK